MHHPLNTIKAEAARKEAKARLRELGNHFDNRDSCAEDYAVENLLAARPAFWSTRGHHNASSGSLLHEVNHLASIAGAFEEVARCSLDRSIPDSRREELLDQLLPLNDQAVRELGTAYRAVGSFRDAYELIRRTAKAEGSYQPILNSEDRVAAERV